MINQLQKIGRDNTLVLDRAVMEQLGLRENAEVVLTVSGGSLVVTPVEPSLHPPPQFEGCLDRVVNERRDVLRRLAQ